MKTLLKYFFQGLLILLPVAATAYVLYVVVVTLNELVFDRVGYVVSEALGLGAAQTVSATLGAVATFVLVTLVGMLASNFLGRKLVALFDALLQRVPLIKLLYGSIKDLLGAFMGDKKSFDRPVCVSLTPDGSARVLGFVTREGLGQFGLADHVAVYLPQSYNFAGNLILTPRDRVEFLETDSSAVMTFLVSGGVSGD